MQIFDISILLNHHTPVWPGDGKIEIKTLVTREPSQDFQVTQFRMTSHCGTHLDAPFHLSSSGTRLTEFPLARLVLPARVVEYGGEDHISAEFVCAIAGHSSKGVLFKTRNSQFWQEPTTDFQQDYVALTAAAADELVTQGIQLVGIDYLSIDPFDSKDYAAHRILLQHDVLVLEGLNLGQIPPADYQLICLPLKLAAPDGAPVRAILLKA